MKWLVLLLPLYMAQNLIGNYVLTTSYLEMEYKILNQNENIVPGSMTALQANNYV